MHTSGIIFLQTPFGGPNGPLNEIDGVILEAETLQVPLGDDMQGLHFSIS